MSAAGIIGLIGGVLSCLAIIFAGIRWVAKAVKDASFDNGKHTLEHENITTQMDAAHDKIRKHDQRIGEIETRVSNVDGKMDTMLENQQTILSVLMAKNQ